MKGVELVQIESVGARLAVDLLPDQIRNRDAPFDVKVRLENPGDVKLHDLQVNVELPRGLEPTDDASLPVALRIGNATERL